VGTAVAAYGDEEASESEVASVDFTVVAGEAEYPGGTLARARVTAVHGSDDGWAGLIGFGAMLVIGICLAVGPILLGGYLLVETGFRLVYGR
jgi:hypothetical protein